MHCNDSLVCTVINPLVYTYITVTDNVGCRMKDV